MDWYRIVPPLPSDEPSTSSSWGACCRFTCLMQQMDPSYGGLTPDAVVKWLRNGHIAYKYGTGNEFNACIMGQWRTGETTTRCPDVLMLGWIKDATTSVSCMAKRVIDFGSELLTVLNDENGGGFRMVRAIVPNAIAYQPMRLLHTEIREQLEASGRLVRCFPRTDYSVWYCK